MLPTIKVALDRGSSECCILPDGYPTILRNLKCGLQHGQQQPVCCRRLQRYRCADGMQFVGTEQRLSQSYADRLLRLPSE